MTQNVRVSLFLFLGAILLAGCQLSPGPLRSAATPTSVPADTQPAATPIPAARISSATASATAAVAATTDLPGVQTNGPLRSAAAWTATFQAFTEEAHARETKNAAQETQDAAQVTPGPANNATLEAQYWITETAVVSTMLTTVPPHVANSYRSPDGKWLANIILYPCTRVHTDPEYWPDALEILRIRRMPGIRDQEIERQHYFCGGQGAYGFEGKFWTPDSRFFYYTNAREGWPDGGYPWRRPISRFDTLTGKSETLYEAVFSPGQTRIAGAQGMDLVVWDINDDTVRRFSGLPTGHSPDGATVWAAWSPDGRRLAYLTNSFCQDVSPCPATLFLVDTQTWQQTQLLGPSDPRMMTVEWEGPNTLSLWGADFRTTWLLDLKTKTLITATPTLTPLPSRSPKP